MNRSLTPQMLVWAYRHGIFPMAHGRDGPIDWFDPPTRGIFPLDALHLSRSLQRRVRRNDYEIRVDTAFERVVLACAEPGPGREQTWINDAIVDTYTQLHEANMAHSVEAWAADDPAGDATLVGGLYGVSLGAAFFGESMFSRATDASKVCLVHLVEHLRTRGFTLLDTQFTTPHLKTLGAIEIRRDEYHRRLRRALRADVSF